MSKHFMFSSGRGVGLALAMAFIGVGVVRADGGTPVARWGRVASDPRWVQGDVTVNAPPDVVWARLARVDEWPRSLTDIQSVKVLDRRTDDRGHTRWKIELETRTLDHGMLGYDVDSDPARTLLLTTNRLGVSVVAQTLVRPGPTRDQANVVYSFFIELSGLPSLFISEKSLRQKQEHMVDVTLGDIGRAFPKPAAAPASAAAR
jgi:carbon monoxide dehydrogenase subunit G